MSRDAEEAKKIRAEKAKDEGNKAFRAKDYEKALQLYNIAIDLDPEKVILVFLYSSLTCMLKQTNKLVQDTIENQRKHQHSHFHNINHHSLCW